MSDISENIFYSWIMQSITRIKDKEETQKADISSCEYTPPKEKIQDEIQKIDDEIKEKKPYKEQFNIKRLPATADSLFYLHIFLHIFIIKRRTKTKKLTIG